MNARNSYRIGAMASCLALVAAAALEITTAGAAAAASATPSGTVWLPYPNSDSLESGDGSLDLVTNFGSTASVTSSTAPLASATAVSAVSTNFTVLMRTADGSAGALPPNVGSQSLLDSTRVGVTPTSTVLEGGHGNLTLDLTETKPYEPSTSIGSTAAQITNGPFMYFVVNVTNTGASSSSPSAVYVGMDGACGAAMPNFPAAGSVALPLCSSADPGGTRYLVANTGSGVAAAVGTSLASGFVSTGTVSGSGSSGTAALSLQVPALASGATWSTTLVYGGWNTSAGIKQLNGSVSGFYYRQWWANAAAMLSFAQQQAASAIAASSSFDANVNSIAADDASRYAAAHAFRGWRHEQWLVGTTAAPQYYVTEGAFGYLSTLDVAYEYQALQTRFEPWKSKLELDALAGAYETDSAGNRYLQHDVGQWSALTPGPAYDLKAGTRKHMAVEHNLDFVAMALLWEAQTGQTYNHAMLQLLLNSVEAHDTNSDGIFDVASMTACRPDGTCRTSELGTTYDGQVTAAASSEAGNTILGVKAGVVESIAATKGYTSPSGGSLATVAQRHLTAEQPFATRLSSMSSLSGYNKHPGYLSDALLYAALLGSNATLAPNLSWLGSALASNHAADTSSCSVCIAPISSGDKISWVSKALDGDVVADWLAADFPSVSRPGLDLPKVSAIWVGRSSGLNTGGFEAVAYPGQTYLRGDYYPRSASIWGALWVGNGSGGVATITGKVTGNGGAALAGATVQACPKAGQPCAGATLSASNGSYTIKVAPGTYWIWASAPGFTDTYAGGGHRASDPANVSTTVSSGSTTVNLAMAAGTATASPIYIDSGSTSSFTGSDGTVWSADRFFSGGKTFTAATAPIAGTSDDDLYLTQRYGDFSYSIPEPAGTYNVTLKLAETWATAAGQRVFSVQAEGATVVSNLDIFAEVGANTVDDKTFSVDVSDGALTLDFVTGVQNPMVEGIAVVPASGPAPSPGTVSGVVSSTAGGAVSGATVSVCPSAGVACGVTATTGSNGSYSVSVPAGSYYVWATASGFTDTYSGGGHSASDPADAKVSVTSGNTTTVSLAMPPVPPSPGTVSGVVSSTAGGAVSGATVSVCPSAGVACGVTATTGSNGSYSVSVPAGSYYVWATASGFTDTYSGGGHSASDPADAKVSVTSGNTTTVSLAMPPASAPSFTPVYINAGSTSSFTDSAGNVWAKDQMFSGGKTFTAATTPIAGTSDDKLYLTQRYGAFTYSIPAPAGSYQVTLKLAETWATAAGQRVFSVQAEGANVISNLDIFAEVGANTADDKTFTVNVTDGALTLTFVTGVQNPMVEGISVVSTSTAPAPPSPGTVSGVVSSTGGGAVSGATVSVCPSAGVACGVTATTGSNGSYSVSVPAGSYYVWATASGFTDTYSGGGHSASDPADAKVSVTSGNTTTVSLAMPPVPPAPGAVSGVISQSGGGAISGATVSVCANPGDACGATATTSSTGSYSISVAPGNYYVWATAAGYTDQYFGGGHSASDPADTAIAVTSGGTTSVSLAMSQVSPPPASFTPIYINAGSTSSYTDSSGTVWQKDSFFLGGKTYAAKSQAIAGTTADPLYVTQRYGAFSYSIPVPNGTYQVTLKLAETWATSAGQRIFSVQAEGATVISDLDIFAEVGAYAVDDKTFTVTVNDGALSLSFVTGVQNPMVEGIAVQGVNT